MGAYYTRGDSDTPRNYRRRLQRAQRTRDQKRELLHKTLREAGWEIGPDGYWVAAQKASGKKLAELPLMEPAKKLVV